MITHLVTDVWTLKLVTMTIQQLRMTELVIMIVMVVLTRMLVTMTQQQLWMTALVSIQPVRDAWTRMLVTMTQQ